MTVCVCVCVGVGECQVESGSEMLRGVLVGVAEDDSVLVQELITSSSTEFSAK